MTGKGLCRAGLAIMSIAALVVPAAFANWQRNTRTIDGGIVSLLEAHGAHILRDRPRGANADAIEAVFPGCDGPVNLVPVSSALEEEIDYGPQPASRGTTTFIYLGAKYSRPDHARVWAAYLIALSRNLFRTRPLINLDEIVVATTIGRCPAFFSMDWDPVWNPVPVKAPP